MFSLRAEVNYCSSCSSCFILEVLLFFSRSVKDGILARHKEKLKFFHFIDKIKFFEISFRILADDM